jgi:hypothetical protein
MTAWIVKVLTMVLIGDWRVAEAEYERVCTDVYGETE